MRAAAPYVAAVLATHDTRLYLREWRKKRRLTQKELAKLTGIPESTISRYEHGERRVHVGVLGKLAAALGVRPGWLLEPPP